MATPADTIPGPGRTVAFRTIGCKLNQCETAQMQETLLVEGYRLVDWDSAADIRVVNTCTVTAKSDSTCRHEIRLAKRLDPACTVVVTGCYAQIDPAAVAAIPGVDLVLGNLDKLRLAQHLAALPPTGPGAGEGSLGEGSADGGGSPCGGAGGAGGAGGVEATGAPTAAKTGARPAAAEAGDHHRAPALSVSPYPEHPEFEGEFFTHFYGYTRAFLKVQTGCDSRCAYCIIPSARGPARSMPLADVLREVDLLAGRGFREVVLTGGGRDNTPIVEPIRQFLQCQGVPPQVISLETRSNSTRENALYTKDLLAGVPGRKVLLTSDFHMFRAHRAFRKVGLDVQPRPYPDVRKRAGNWRGRWTSFLDLSEETVKIFYYYARGWI